MPGQLELWERSQWQKDHSGINNSAGSRLWLPAVISPELSSSCLLEEAPSLLPARLEVAIPSRDGIRACSWRNDGCHELPSAERGDRDRAVAWDIH